MSLILRRLRRYGRQVPREAFTLFVGDTANWQQWFSLSLAVATTYIGLQTAAVPAMIEAGTQWANAIQAFIYVAAAWAVVCVVRSPFSLISRERASGYWRGDRFIFFAPLLVWSERCQATGQVEMYRFKVPFVEAGGFMYFSLSLDPDVRGRAEWGLGGAALMGPMSAGQWPGTGGTRLTSDGEAIFQLRLKPGTISTTAKVYCHSFSFENPDDVDGVRGNYRFPVRD